MESGLTNPPALIGTGAAKGVTSHQTKKGNQWYHRFAEGFAYGMKIHISVNSESGLIYSVETTAAHVHDLTPAADLLHGEATVAYADGSYQGIEKREEMQGRGIDFRFAMRPGTLRVLPDMPEGRLDDLVETAIAGRASACSGVFPRQRRTSISCDQTAVRLSEGPTAGNAQKPLQNECAGRPLEPIHDTSQAAMQFVTGGLVWPLRARIPRITNYSCRKAEIRLFIKPRIPQKLLIPSKSQAGPSLRARCPEVP